MLTEFNFKIENLDLFGLKTLIWTEFTPKNQILNLKKPKFGLTWT